jgi:hypothetical protein
VSRGGFISLFIQRQTHCEAPNFSPTDQIGGPEVAGVAKIVEQMRATAHPLLPKNTEDSLSDW